MRLWTFIRKHNKFWFEYDFWDDRFFHKPYVLGINWTVFFSFITDALNCHPWRKKKSKQPASIRIHNSTIFFFFSSTRSFDFSNGTVIFSPVPLLRIFPFFFFVLVLSLWTEKCKHFISFTWKLFLLTLLSLTQIQIYMKYNSFGLRCSQTWNAFEVWSFGCYP